MVQYRSMHVALRWRNIRRRVATAQSRPRDGRIVPDRQLQQVSACDHGFLIRAFATHEWRVCILYSAARFPEGELSAAGLKAGSRIKADPYNTRCGAYVRNPSVALESAE